LHDPYLLPRFLLLHCRALPDYPVVISIVAIPVKANAAGIRHAPSAPRVKRAFEIGPARNSYGYRLAPSATARPRFRAGAVSKSPERSDFLPALSGTGARLV
jgi:hypothetical protein